MRKTNPQVTGKVKIQTLRKSWREQEKGNSKHGAAAPQPESISPRRRGDTEKTKINVKTFTPEIAEEGRRSQRRLLVKPEQKEKPKKIFVACLACRLCG